MGRPSVDYAGQDVAGVRVVERAGHIGAHIAWCVRCACGVEFTTTSEVIQAAIRRGGVVSCRSGLHWARLAGISDEVARGPAAAQTVAEMSPAEQEVARRRVLAEEPESLDRLAERLGVSRQRVRQVESRVRARLCDRFAGGSSK